MKVLLFGATGMVGQGALLACLRDPEVERVIAVVRSPSGRVHDKLREIVQADVTDLSKLREEIASSDVTMFCLGVSSAGMSEADYTRVTHDLTLDVARQVLAANPAMKFMFVSGAGTDSSERGHRMWARVKGRTENALLRMPFASSAMFRPGAIQPLDGIRSKTPLYQAFYGLAKPIFPLVRKLAPSSVTTTDELGRAMLRVAKEGADRSILEASDIVRIAQSATSPAS